MATERTKGWRGLPTKHGITTSVYFLLLACKEHGINSTNGKITDYLFRLVPTIEADSLPFRVRNGIGNVSLSSSSSSQFPPLPPARLPSVLPLIPLVFGTIPPIPYLSLPLSSSRTREDACAMAAAISALMLATLASSASSDRAPSVDLFVLLACEIKSDNARSNSSSSGSSTPESLCFFDFRRYVILGSGSHDGSCVRMCCVRVVRRVNVFSHSGSSHLYGRFPVCVRRCRARLLESPKVLSHPWYSHECGFSPVCTRWCTCSADL